MTGRPTFGDFLTAAHRSLAPRPGPPPARGDVQEVSRSLLRVVTVLARYTEDTATAFTDIPRRAPAPADPWDRARVQALQALVSSAAFLHHPGTGRPAWPASASASRPARRLDELATALATGRDLLHTHFAPGPDGGRAPNSPWALAITSERLNRALLTEIGALASQIARHGAIVALTPGPGAPANTDQRRALNTACHWLWALRTCIEAARQQQPVPAADQNLLAAIPTGALPAHPALASADSIPALCAAVTITAERLRHLAWHTAHQPPWSPGLTMTSLRQAAETSTLTSHHCALLTGLLASTAVSGAFLHATTDLTAAARDSRRASRTWYQIARALREVTTDTRGQVSPAAAEARDLAWWTGRLAHADPAWTLTSGPHSPLRSPGDLVLQTSDLPQVVAAVHQAADALALLADTEHRHLHGALQARRLLVPTRTLSSDHDIPRPYGPAPEECTGPLLAHYHDARKASHQAATSAACAAYATGAPSRVLVTAHEVIYAAPRVSAAMDTGHRGAPSGREQESEPPGHIQQAQRSPGVTGTALLDRRAESWPTRAVLDAIHSGQLRAELPGDCGFWAARAAEQQMQAEAGSHVGLAERQLEDWDIHTDHADGLTADYDLDREA